MNQRKWDNFERELTALINAHSLENECGHTPDFVLADYCTQSLKGFAQTVARRSRWYQSAENDPLIPKEEER